MFPKVGTNPDLAAEERAVLAFWQATDVFGRLQRQNGKGPRWSFLDGPITANNPMGVHHAWGRTYKDCYQRYHAMKGRRLRYQNGFDCQGLWVEVEVEKELGFTSKRDIEAFGLERFVNACKERARRFSRIQTQQSVRLGYWMDWDNSYTTMSDENNYTIWAFLKRCHDRGLVYKGADSMPWCPRCGTGISQHEMHEGYKEVTDLSVFFRLPLLERRGEYLLVWTTTPWTLPAHVACAINPSVEYVRARQGDAVYYVAAALADVLNENGAWTAEDRVSGATLVGLRYAGPFDDLPAQHTAKEHHRVVAWEDVSETEGTGIVHIAPGCGKEDFDLAGSLGLPILAPIDESGRYVDGHGPLTGKHAQHVRDEVLRKLRRDSLFYRAADYVHSYPHCWRCGTALLFRHVHEWFISMSWREEIKAAARQARWIPAWGLARELDWLENMRDWMISKKRYWGLALPIFECECGRFDVIGSKEELRARAVAGWAELEGHSPHRPWIDSLRIRCAACGSDVPRIPDVGNPWLDAGIVPYSTLGYMQDRDEWARWMPADLVLECFPGQFRNWFYALLAMSTMMEGRAPFRTLVGHGLVKDENGEEMHKSKGNAVWFDEAAEAMGVDVMRWLFCRQPPCSNLNFGYAAGKQIERSVFGTLWNVYAFLCNYARIDAFDPAADVVPLSERPDMDRWLLSDLNALVGLANGCLTDFDVASLVHAAERFIERLSNWYVRRNRRRFWRTAAGSDRDKLAAYQTLHRTLVTLCRLLAPVAPFITESIYRGLTAEADSADDSVHLCRYPDSDDSFADPQLSADMDATAELVSRGLSLRQSRQLRVRQPLDSLTVAGADADRHRAFVRLQHHILEELNLKRLAFVDDATSLAQTAVKPNTRRLGPRFRDNLPRVLEAVRRLDPDRAAQCLAAGDGLTVRVDGEEHLLTADDVLAETSFPQHLAVREAHDYSLALDTRLSEALVSEGIARDFVRHVQIRRKELDLELDDRIVLTYATANEGVAGAVEQWAGTIRGEVLAEQHVRVAELANGKVLRIGSAEVVIGITRA